MAGHTPPLWMRKLLSRLHPEESLEEVEGDLEELYARWHHGSGKLRADLRYLFSVISVLPPFVRKRQKEKDDYKRSIINPDMLNNYFKIAWRNLIHHKSYSLINIGGLAAGMAVAILVGLWVNDEFAFNHCHKNYREIAQVMRHEWFEGKKETGGQSSPIPLGHSLRYVFGEDFKQVILSTKPVSYIISGGDNKFNQTGRFMEAGAADLLSLHMIRGSRAGLEEVNTILISETLARKLFGEADPLNQLLTIDTQISAKITGVYKDIPSNSEFRDVTYIAPFDLYKSFNPWVVGAQDNWGDNSFPIYVQLAPGRTFEEVSARIKQVMIPHLSKEKASRKPEVFLHPMTDWHLFSEFENGRKVTSEALKYVFFYSLTGLFVLFLACINFTNLATARSEKRSREVGIRKALGSVRVQLAGQFLSESVLVALIAFCLGIILVRLLLPSFNEVADKEVAVLWTNPVFWAAGVAFTLLTAFLAGSYPSFYLSSLHPVKTLKGTFSGGKAAIVSRKMLVVFQFTISIALIIGTVSVYQQIQLAKGRPVGYDRAGLLSFPSNGFRGKEDILRDELLRTGVVSEVAESAYQLTNEGSNNTGFDWRGKTPAMSDDFGTIRVSADYGKTVGWKFIAGRDFSGALASDSSGLIINEAAAKLMGLKNPVGELIRSDHWNKGTFKILGVVSDMVMASPFEKVRPAFFSLKGKKNWMLVRIDPQITFQTALPKLEAVFRAIASATPFEYKFADEEYALKFAAEERIGKLTFFFTVLAVFISCLGLFGLSSFMVERRIKEIGVRKVLGASVPAIWRLLSREFVILVIMAFLIATPLASYILGNWLNKYEYRTGISWEIVVLSGGGALLVTLITVSFQTIRAALMDPVKSLRSE